jgi:hypothetical protein
MPEGTRSCLWVSLLPGQLFSQKSFRISQMSLSQQPLESENTIDHQARLHVGLVDGPQGLSLDPGGEGVNDLHQSPTSKAHGQDHNNGK